MADRVLILGGTAEARALAAALAEDERFEAVTTLAGRTAEPAPVAGALRIGGFGGAAGLAAHLSEGGFSALVDATHPFARQISAHAAEAARIAGVPRLALVRPEWEAGDGDRWIAADDEPGAAAAIVGLDLPKGATVFLALGRQRPEAFAALTGLDCVLRTVDPVDPPWPGCRIVTGRGPFDEAAEHALLEAEGIAAVVCRNSGGASGATKLAAARSLGLPVVMIRRPPPPEPPVMGSVKQALVWLTSAIPPSTPA